jgi:hypothetical protein
LLKPSQSRKVDLLSGGHPVDRRRSPLVSAGSNLIPSTRRVTKAQRQGPFNGSLISLNLNTCRVTLSRAVSRKAKIASDHRSILQPCRPPTHDEMSHPAPAAPLFTSNGLLDFDLPTPPLSDLPEDRAKHTYPSVAGSGPSSSSTSARTEKRTAAHDAMELDEELLIMAAEAEARSRGWAGSPPPEMDMEEEPDWEEEERLMRELETEGDGRPSRDARYPATSVVGTGNVAPEQTFIPSDIFDFEEREPIAGSCESLHPLEAQGPATDGASDSARAPLTPPPEDIPLVFASTQPVAECSLPPLHAETSSGRIVSFKRRFKPTPAPLIVCTLSVLVPVVCRRDCLANNPDRAVRPGRTARHASSSPPR